MVPEQSEGQTAENLDSEISLEILTIGTFKDCCRAPIFSFLQ